MGIQGSKYYREYFKNRSLEVPVGTNLENLSNNHPVWKGRQSERTAKILLSHYGIFCAYLNLPTFCCKI